ncbi:MAG: hypothetical protein KDK23_00510 [Leptospiraceae bacterium]|nr:hypothetical protein [Leptospiraceae bacterium]
MQKLVRELLNDSSSGLRKDASGRQYFRQRRVRFQTIEFEARGLMQGGWLDFQEDLESPFLRAGDPSPAEIKQFALLSSERFLNFYYRVFDVAVARALATLDTRIFRIPFIKPSVFLDLGIPEETDISSLPPALHNAILEQYKRSRNGKRTAGQTRVYFLSQYLEGLTDDAIELLHPYRKIWELEDELQTIHAQSKFIRFQWEDILLQTSRLDYLQRFRSSLRKHFKSAGMETILRATAQAELRKALRSFVLDNQEEAFLLICRHIDSHGAFLNKELRTAVQLAYLPEKLETAFRSALLQETRLHARLMRWIHLRYRNASLGANADFRLIIEQRNQTSKDALQLIQSLQKLTDRAGQLERMLKRHANIRKEIRNIYLEFSGGAASSAAFPDPGLPWPQELHSGQSDEKRSGGNIGARKSGIAGNSEEREKENSVEGFKESSREAEFAAADTSAAAKTVESISRKKYGNGIEWPSHIVYGDPFHRREALLHIKQQILDRLRPVRSTTTGYSLIPGTRHGILPLNPVLKLWKDKPGFERDLPPVAALEINTIDTVNCLLLLAQLAHPELDQLKLRLGRIVQEKRGNLNLENLTFFLMPGSCGAAREIERPDFPEFRNSVIGESRNPSELGLAGEPSILTGAWYKKRNHALYYPIGGDNGQLLRSIFLALRLPRPAAFFFALGQFVHDCLPDNLVYYAGSEIPFRQITEDYYRLEDRVRKNRGEKTGRRRIDNSRPAVRFMFAVSYSRILMEALTGSSQSNFRHPPTEQWMSRYLDLPALSISDRSRFRRIRSRAREIISGYAL